MLFKLLKVAEILGTSNVVASPQSAAVTSYSSPSVLSSPTVLEYMKTLPRKTSPLKSPLSRYKRRKTLKQSPLKAISTRSRVNLLGSLQQQTGSVSGCSPPLLPPPLPVGGPSVRTTKRPIDHPLPLPPALFR